MTEASPFPRLAELDALRGIAVSMVVLFHYSWQGVNVLPTMTTIPWGLSWGHYGVELFFAISGFVIFMTLERTRTTADFVVSRFARLFPAYWFGIGLTSGGVLLLGASTLAQPPEVALVNLTMLQGFFYLPSVDGVYWSLTVELGFYVCMLALWRCGLLAQIETVLLGWIALKLLWWGVPALPSRIGALLVEQYIPWFAIGMAAYRVHSGARRWRDQAMVLLAGLVAVAVANEVADAAVYVGVAAVFVAITAGHLRFLNHPLLLWLGAISYPLYLVHQNLGYALIVALERIGSPPALALVIAIAAALATAQAVHLMIEAPSLALIRNWWKSRRIMPAPA